MKKTGIIIQARTTSSRFPNKIFYEINGKKIIEYVIEECLKVENVKTILATPSNQIRDFEFLQKKYDIPISGGSEDDLVERFYKTAEKYKLETIVRVTSDCPLMNCKIIQKTLNFYNENNYDFVANTTLDTSFKNKKNIEIEYKSETYLNDGFDIEIFSFEALVKTYINAKTKSEREHVTIWIKEHLNCGVFDDLFLCIQGKLSLDRKEDLEGIETFLNLINDGFVKLGEL